MLDPQETQQVGRREGEGKEEREKGWGGRKEGKRERRERGCPEVEIYHSISLHLPKPGAALFGERKSVTLSEVASF